MEHTKVTKILFVLFAVVLSLGPVGLAEPVGTAFTYQGRLIDANNAADGLYDFQFKLFDANIGVNKLGPDVNKAEVDVIDGYFTVELDFGSVYDGNSRWLEIGVRPGALDDPCDYSVLIPRQKLTPTPYALYALNGGGGGGGGGISGSGTANTIAKFTSGTAIGDSVIYESSGNVGIGTASPSNMLDVSGGINTAVGYAIDNRTVLTNPGTGNIFVGDWTGWINTTGSDNTFVGDSAGGSNETGDRNTFLGNGAGYSNTTGTGNVFIGYGAGNGVTDSYKLYIETFPYDTLIYGDFSTGRIGLGTKTPGAKLEVAGQVKITGGSPGNGKVLTSDAAGLATWQTPAGAETDPQVSSATTNSVPKWNGTTLVDSGVYDTGGFVGIGTASPTAELEVNGKLLTDYLQITGGAPGTGKVLTSDGSGNAWWQTPVAPPEIDPQVTSTTAGSVPKWNGSTLVDGTIYDNGNIGIGTVSPGAKLEVNGQVKITGGTPGNGKVLTSDASGLATWQTPAPAGDNLGNHIATQNIQLNTHWLSGDGGNEGIYVAADGSVGIGKSTPTNSLDVSGHVNTNETYKMDGLSVLANPGNRNIFVDGSGAAITTGYDNAAIGDSALLDNSSGGSNAAMGSATLNNNATGNNNSAMGRSALGSNVSGSNNSALGYYAGYGALGSGNVFLGYEAGYSEAGSNKLYIDNDGTGALIYGDFSTNRVGIGLTDPTESLDVVGTARLRGIGTGGTGTAVLADTAGKLWKQSSSQRYKTNIETLDTGADAVFKLRPVSFEYKETGQKDIGLIAEEVEKISPDLVIYDGQGRPDAVKYDKVALYLLSVVKNQQEQIATLKEKISQNKSLEQRVDAMESLVANLSQQKEGGIK